MLGTQILRFAPQHTLVIFHKSRCLLFLDIALSLMNLLVFHLTFPYILEWSRIYFHLHDFRISDNPNIELVELVAQLGQHLLYSKLAHMGPSTPSIDYHNCFSRVEVNSKIVILNKL
jgi:hypothetical protein